MPYLFVWAPLRILAWEGCLAQQACGNVGPICSRIAIKKCQGVTTIMYKDLQKRTDKIELFIRFALGQNRDHSNHTGCRINFVYDPPIADTTMKPSLQLAGQLFDISAV